MTFSQTHYSLVQLANDPPWSPFEPLRGKVAIAGLDSEKADNYEVVTPRNRG